MEKNRDANNLARRHLGIFKYSQLIFKCMAFSISCEPSKKTTGEFMLTRLSPSVSYTPSKTFSTPWKVDPSSTPATRSSIHIHNILSPFPYLNTSQKPVSFPLRLQHRLRYPSPSNIVKLISDELELHRALLASQVLEDLAVSRTECAVGT